MSVGRRLGILASTYLLLITVGGLAAVLLLQDSNAAAARRRTMLIESEQIAHLRAAYTDQESAVRGYVITGQEPFLEPWEFGRREAERIRAQAITVVAGSPELIQEWAALDAATNQWHLFASSVIEAKRAQMLGGAPTSGEVDMAEGKRLFDALRVRFDEFESSVDREVVRADVATRRAQRLALALVPAIFAAGLAVTLASAWFVRHWLTRPLAGIVQATRDVREGRPATYPSGGPADIREVIESVDAMQRAIFEQRDAAVRAREAMEQHAVLAIQLRSELAHELGSYPSGWTVAAGLLPATGIVAGDSYDVSLINSHTMGVIVLDIAGHGASAAIAALKSKETLKAALRSGRDPGAALELPDGGGQRTGRILLDRRRRLARYRHRCLSIRQCRASAADDHPQ